MASMLQIKKISSLISLTSLLKERQKQDFSELAEAAEAKVLFKPAQNGPSHLIINGIMSDYVLLTGGPQGHHGGAF
jgi:hypothetical protein